MIRKSNLGKETRLSSTHKIDTPEHNYFRFSGSSAESMYNMKHMQVIFTSTEDRIGKDCFLSQGSVPSTQLDSLGTKDNPLPLLLVDGDVIYFLLSY
jgi:hypothetical protein